jgi:hypothetical protein
MNSKIRTLVFLGFTALAVSAAGCVIDSSSPPPPSNCAANRYATVGWEIFKNSNGASLSCEQADATDVVLNFGPYTYNYQCNLYSDTTDAGLAPGPYDATMQLYASNGALLSDTGAPVTYVIPQCAHIDIPTVPFGVP